MIGFISLLIKDRDARVLKIGRRYRRGGGAGTKRRGEGYKIGGGVGRLLG